MNRTDLDRVATDFVRATQDALEGEVAMLPQALVALALQAQAMSLLPRDVAGPNGHAALEAIACAIFSSAGWTVKSSARLRAEWSFIIGRAALLASLPVKPKELRRARRLGAHALHAPQAGV
jgi:hypothetical protein